MSLWPKSEEWEKALAFADRWQREAVRLLEGFHPEVIDASREVYTVLSTPEKPPIQFWRDTWFLTAWCNEHTDGIDAKPLVELASHLADPEKPEQSRYRERLRAMWEQCEQVLQRLQYQGMGSPPAEGEPTAENGDQQNIEKRMEQVAQAVGDDNATKIMQIANRKDWPGERKMEEILRLDSRFAGKDSTEWGTLLNVTPAAVRGYKPWKVIRDADHPG